MSSVWPVLVLKKIPSCARHTLQLRLFTTRLLDSAARRVAVKAFVLPKPALEFTLLTLQSMFRMKHTTRDRAAAEACH